ncbi:sigma-70 family RNA polymerase sigma factor [Pedobacter hartonius]|uniref:RNA polymerase primary sigma factor n=1 Tax=Pedobacter hartonius TaxID=425514 RepID=A0A1H4HC75_9SPHI|nr:sigma-70 family RNA polymerase sigma factor [Pedobacter hartonius]SEB19413.1 RNA polymerase primary sigma factor [Pedobacter hartonius]
MKELKLSSSITGRDAESINRYMAEIAKIPLLTIDEEVWLSQRIKEGDLNAVERLVNANLRFVVSVAKKYQHRGLSLGDLINEGNLGLIKAATKFDHTKGFKFISFAVWWIRQMIILAIAEQTRIIRLPLNLINSISLINKAISYLEQHLERIPTLEEIAAEINIDEMKITDYMYRAYKSASLDSGLNDETDSTMLDMIPGHYAPPDNQLALADEVYDVGKMLSILPHREAEILRLYFGLAGTMPVSLDDIASLVNLSKERVRQLKDRGIKKLRSRMQGRIE